MSHFYIPWKHQKTFQSRALSQVFITASLRYADLIDWIGLALFLPTVLLSIVLILSFLQANKRFRT